MIEEMQTLVDKHPEGYGGWEKDQHTASLKRPRKANRIIPRCIEWTALALAYTINRGQYFDN